MANISSIKLPDGFTYDIKDNSKSTATNWLNGSQTGSLRTISSAAEDSNYTIGSYALAEGSGTVASGDYSHAEGYMTIASSDYSHAEGCGTTASQVGTHVEGNLTTANGSFAHAEGNYTTASGYGSHAEGNYTKARGNYSHAEGYCATASGTYSHVQGKYNIEDETAYTSAAGTTFDSSVTYYTKSDNIFNKVNSPIEADLATYYIYTPNNAEKAFIIGNGNYNAHSNAFTVDWQGRVEAGDYSGTFQSIFDIFYPVGSYYETSDANFDPNIAWGGTWYKEIEGQVHISSGSTYSVSGTDTTSTVGSETRVGTNIGGNKDAIVPYHDHDFTPPTFNSSGGSTSGKATGSTGVGTNHSHTLAHTHGMSHTHAHTHQPNTTTRSFLTATTSGITINRTAIKNGTGTEYSNCLRVGSAAAYNGQTDSDSTASSKSSTDAASVTNTGGESSHTHSLNDHTHTTPNHTHTFATNGAVEYEGVSATNANLQPYIVVHRWHRVA